jgi:hypothetical protein
MAVGQRRAVVLDEEDVLWLNRYRKTPLSLGEWQQEVRSSPALWIFWSEARQRGDIMKYAGAVRAEEAEKRRKT